MDNAAEKKKYTFPKTHTEHAGDKAKFVKRQIVGMK